MAEPRLMMCSPITVPTNVPGSVQLTADCGHQIWLSPSGLRMKLAGKVVLRCENCVDPDDIASIESTPESRAELVALLGSEQAADELIWAAEHDPAYTVRVLQADSRRRRNAQA